MMFAPTMTFYVTRTDDGLVHVQNGLAGMLGQHHVHTPEDFEAWRHPGDDIRDLDGTTCDCGLVAGQTRDHNGRVTTKAA